MEETEADVSETPPDIMDGFIGTAPVTMKPIPASTPKFCRPSCILSSLFFSPRNDCNSTSLTRCALSVHTAQGTPSSIPSPACAR